MANKTLTFEELLSKAEKSLDNRFLFIDFIKGTAADGGKEFYFVTDDGYDLNQRLSKVQELQNKIQTINTKFKNININLTEEQINAFNAFINVKLKELAIEQERLERGIEEANIRGENSDSLSLYKNDLAEDENDDESEFSDDEAQDFKTENDEGIESILKQKLSDEDIKLSIDLLVENIEKHPRVFYEIFINPNFIYDENSAKNMGAVAGDVSEIRNFLEYNENAKFLFSFDRANNNEGMPMKMIFGEFNELADIFAKHLPLNIKNRKEKFYQFKNIDNELNNKLEGFANKHPGYFNLLQNLFNLSSKNPEYDFFLKQKNILI